MIIFIHKAKFIKKKTSQDEKKPLSNDIYTTAKNLYNDIVIFIGELPEMYTLVLILHFIVCVLLILLVLLQSGKGSAAGIFGASGADNLFASPTAFNAVNKFTAILAAVLMCTSIFLTIASNKKSSESVLDSVKIPAPTAPAEAGK